MSPINVRDKKWNIVTQIKSRGTYKIKVNDSSALVEKLFGASHAYRGEEDIYSYFNLQLTSLIIKELVTYLNSLNDELIGINSQCQDISNTIKEIFNSQLKEYGLFCSTFNIISIDVDNNKYNEIDKSQISKIAAIRDAETKSEIFDILGSKWEQQQKYDVLKASANNQGSGGNIAGVALAMASFGNTHNDMPSQSNDAIGKIMELKQLLDSGAISTEEFNELKKHLIKSMSED